MEEIADWGEKDDFPTSIPRKQATPWARFWAKLVDVNLWSLPIGFLVGYLFPEFSRQPAFAGAGGSALFGAILLPLCLAFDAVVLAAFGSTPGRALVGIQVQTTRHGRLNVITALSRNARVYVFGMAMGLPLIALFTYAHNYSKVRGGGYTSWDEALATRVYDAGNNALRSVLAAMLALAITYADRTMAIMEERSASSGLELAATEGLSDGSHSSADPIALELQKAAADIKPQMVDSVTRLDGAEADGRTFIYKYTVTRREWSDEEFKAFFESSIVPNVCSDRKMLDSMRNYQIKYRYIYRLPNSEQPSVNDIDWDECK